MGIYCLSSSLTVAAPQTRAIDDRRKVAFPGAAFGPEQLSCAAARRLFEYIVVLPTLLRVAMLVPHGRIRTQAMRDHRIGRSS